MAAAVSKITDVTSELKSKDQPTIELIKQRRSQELVIGLCGAVGSGVKSLKNTLLDQLSQHGYHVEHIRLSKLIAEVSDDFETDSDLTGFTRYDKLQNLGDSLRLQYGNSIIAELAINEITLLRMQRFGNDNSADSGLKTTKKVAYIIINLNTLKK